MKIFTRIFFFALVSFSLVACSGDSGNYALTPSGEKITIEIARTHEERSRGLMNRTELEESAGMLFVFEQTQPLSFWMKNTLIPLDILFLDSEGTIVDIQTMQPCLAQAVRCPSYTSSGLSLYALEVNAGLARQLNLSVGNTLTLHYAPAPAAAENK